MVKIKHLRAVCLATAGTMILWATGCQEASKPEATASSKMEIRDTTRLEQTQSAAGARADATLYPQHFDGPDLSSLGVAKLDLMLADSHSCNPLQVYLAARDSRYDQERRLTVSRYLQDRGGLKAGQIELLDGPEPSTYAPADPNLKNYDKTDTAADMGGGTGSGGTSGSSTGSSGSTGH
jgi:hypothetical protein